MKIEKVKNYNQKLLAVLGSIGVLFLVVAFISFLSYTIQDFLRFSYEDEQTGILSDEKIGQLQEENKREQVISYETPRLIDTLNSVYIIPVSHKTLDEKEDINGLLNAFSSSADARVYGKTDNRYSKGFYGAYNNVIIYHQKNGTHEKLFNKRLNFNAVNTEYFDNEIYLLIKASEKDTYKDGVINLNDLKSLYIYSFNQNKMKKVALDGMDAYNYTFLNNSTDLVIEFGLDKDKDGSYSNYNEPIFIKKYNFESGELTDMVDQTTTSELQKTLEGTKK